MRGDYTTATRVARARRCARGAAYNEIAMLDERAKTLLKTLVERYIADGQPVGSRTLSRASGLELSPATIRNVMADLEELGLIASPHTSAGRIPTARGYRLFVDTMLTAQPLELRSRRQPVEPQLPPDQPQRVIANAAQLLSNLSSFVGVVTAPRKASVFHHIEFLRLSRAARAGDPGGARRRRAEPRHLHRAGLHRRAQLVEASNYLNRALRRPDASRRCASGCKTEVDALRGEIAALMQAAVQAGSEAHGRQPGAGRRSPASATC